jgi:hypothetical protein
MLLLQQPMLALQLLQPLDLAFTRSFARTGLRLEAPWSETSLTELLPPTGKHERVDVECLGHGLHLDPGPMTELHRRALELDSVLLRLLRARSAHPTPPG